MAVAVAALVVMLAGACVLADDADAATTTYTVTFYDGDTEYATVPVTVEEGASSMTVTLPDEPTKAGYAFAGWATTPSGVTESDGSTTNTDDPVSDGSTTNTDDPVSDGSTTSTVVTEAGDATYTYTSTSTLSDLKLYATYTVETYTVTFVVDGVTVATADSGSLDKPIFPAKEHYTFLGWADDEGKLVIVYDYIFEDYVDYSDVVFSEDTTLHAAWQAETCAVTFMAGDELVAVLNVEYGQTVASVSLPDGYSGWDFDFTKAITTDVTISAIEAEPVVACAVNFVVDGAVIAVYDSKNVTLPSDPSKEGYEFAGWAIGTEIISDPVAYAMSAEADTVFVATFVAVAVEHVTVTFDDNGTVTTVDVVKGSVLDEIPAVTDGYQWDPAVDLSAAITDDMTISAVPETVTVTFYVGQTRVSALSATIAYGSTYDTSRMEGYTLPSGYTGWDFDFTQAIYADTAVYALEAEQEPAFWETSTGQIAIFLVICLVLALLYMYMHDTFGLRSRLTGKKDKEE